MDYSRFVGLEFEMRPNGVLLILMANPSRKNAMHRETHANMGPLWREVSADPSVRVAVLTGKGDAFCAGGDLSTAEHVNQGGAFEAEELMTDTRDLVLEMLECHKPIVSAINGVAVGGGLALALGADISFIDEDAYILDGHMKLGVAAGDHSVLLWPLLTSMAKAKYYLLTCDRITGREAAELGLVSKAVPGDTLLEEALKVADQLARGPQPAIRLTKRALNQWFKVGLPAFELSLAYEMMGVLSDDCRAGVEAVRSKHEARFPSAEPMSP
jgi:enoyl-CoA hydratase